MSKILSIVVPIRNEEQNLPFLRLEIETLKNALAEIDISIDLIVNDNASTDGSHDFLSAWSREVPWVRFFHFQVNRGFQGSIISGMREAKGDALVVLQGDLQDPPFLIIEFVKAWLQGSNVVGAVIRKRNEKFFQKFLRKVFYWFLDISADQNIVKNFQDFYLLDKTVYLQIAQSPISHSFVRARIAAEFGLDTQIFYNRDSRKRGQSKFNFSAKYDLAFDALLAYGKRLNRIVSLASIFVASVCLLVGSLLLISFLFGNNFAQKGWLSLILVLFFGFSFLIFISSIVLEYLFRIYKLEILNSKF